MKSWKGCSRQREQQNERPGGRGVSETLGDSVFQPKEGLWGKLEGVKEFSLGDCPGPAPRVGVWRGRDDPS